MLIQPLIIATHRSCPSDVSHVFRQIGKERQLRFDPCTMQFFPLGQYILMGGSNRECVLYTKEGIKLDTIGTQESWVWCAAPRPDSNYVVRALDFALPPHTKYPLRISLLRSHIRIH